MNAAFDDRQADFPARTIMKIITDMPDSAAAQKARLEAVFHQLFLAPKNWSHKSSGKKKYISFTTTVHIRTRKQLYTLYENLQALPEVRQVL